MPSILTDLRTLRLGGDLTTEGIRQIRDSKAEPTQRCALAYYLASKEARPAHETELLEELIGSLPQIRRYLNVLFPSAITPHGDDMEPAMIELLLETRRDARLGRERIGWFISGLVDGSISSEEVTIWLTKVCADGLCEEDVSDLTRAMRDSGQVYDYRNLDALDHRRIIRRYPTGALSEKTALILPSLLSACRVDYPLASPFLVGRSLGFTGGTWDKLSAIPGFTFPEPGDRSIAAMQECGVAMTVTQGDVNPADRLLYQLRSVTGTIESDELIISSIGSKQLSYPADLLLLDVRYGDGAFFPALADAHRVADRLVRVLESEGVPSFCHFTDTPQPTGMAVGNSVEVLESLAILGCSDLAIWDERAINEQAEIVVSLFAALMHREFAGSNQENWRDRARAIISDGTALSAFWDILLSHGVSKQTVSRLSTEPSSVMLPGEPVNLVAPQSGVLRRLDQRKLGDIINFQLGAGGNEYAGSLDLGAGVVLRIRLGDSVSEGDPLCLIYGGENLASLTSDLAACFELEGE